MTLIEKIEKRTSALKVAEVAKLLDVTPQHIYSLISRGVLPAIRIDNAIRLDPHELAAWLRRRLEKTPRTSRPHAA
jgi:excisionase family DNA binding protein